MKKKAFGLFKKNSGSIEIVRDDKIQTIFFPILPFCKMLPSELRREFRENVDRTSTKTKLSNLMERSDFMIQTMKHEERLRRLYAHSKLLEIFAHRGKLWE